MSDNISKTKQEIWYPLPKMGTQLLTKGAFALKRGALALLLAIILVLALTLPAAAQPTVTVDGSTLSFEVPPIIEGGRTLVPLRAIFEALGADVAWGGATQTVTGTKDATTVKLTIGSKTAYVSGQTVTLEVPGKIVGGRTLVPLRFVGEGLGADVVYDGTTRQITITSGVSIPPAAPTPTQELAKVLFIDVGQGDAIYIELPNNVDILIDTGDVGYGLTVVNYLRSRNVDDIEILIATHPHANHIGGLPAVFEAYDVWIVVDPAVSHTTQAYQRYWPAVQAEGADYQKAAGQSWTFGNCTLDILGPTHAHKDLNNNSVIARLSCPGGSFIFTGDAEADAEGAILHKNLDANILKVGHHGSRTSTTDVFLAAVGPEVAVIMVGEGNRYGHPHDETLAKLTAAGIQIYRTDLHGTIVISMTDRGYSISTQRAATVQPAPTPTPMPSPDPVPERVNINTATVDELQLIVHIGPERAQEIIRLRPFISLDDLTLVTGIGLGRLADIKAQGVAYVE